MRIDELEDWFRSQYEALVWSVVQATGSPYWEVEDGLQAALVDLFRRWFTLDGRLYFDESGDVRIADETGRETRFFFYIRTAAIRETNRRAVRRRRADPRPGRVEEPAGDDDPPRTIEQGESERRFQACLAELTDAQRRYLHRRFCTSEFRLPTRTAPARVQVVPRPIDRLRRCLESRGHVFEDLIHVLPNFLRVLCGGPVPA